MTFLGRQTDVHRFQQDFSGSHGANVVGAQDLGLTVVTFVETIVRFVIISFFLVVDAHVETNTRGQLVVFTVNFLAEFQRVEIVLKSDNSS